MNWPYTRRSDGKIAVTLDNNVWDFLFAKTIDLACELPSEHFALFITREIEIETMAIRGKESKAALNAYIILTIAQCDIKTTSVFGFSTPDVSPQRLGGWGQGTWQSQTEREFYAAISGQYLLGRRERGSKLTDNEGDAAIAAQSFFSIALTCDKPDKPGPLRFAAEHGGRVLYLPGLDQSGLTLKDFVTAFHEAA